MLDTTQETPRLNLRICGNRSSIVDMDAVRRVPTPQATNRWKPIPHSKVVDVTRNNLEDKGFEILNECHNVTKGGEHYFGMFQVNHADLSDNGGEGGFGVGMRELHDKLFAAGLCAGDVPFICGHLIFLN